MKYNRNEEAIKNFGNRVRELRKIKNLSQEELAFQAGLDLKQLGSIERGKVNTSITHIYAIAKALNMEVKELFDF